MGYPGKHSPMDGSELDLRCGGDDETDDINDLLMWALYVFLPLFWIQLEGRAWAVLEKSGSL